MPNKSKPTKRRPLYKSPPPKGGRLQGPLAKDPIPDELHATPILTAPFELHDDGSILVNGHAPEVEQIKTPPPTLTFSDPAHHLWLYHGNSLELLDAIAAKYP